MHHSLEWCVSSDEVGIGDSRWQYDSESIAQTPGILDGCPTPTTANGHRDRPSSRNQFVEPHSSTPHRCAVSVSSGPRSLRRSAASSRERARVWGA